MEIGENAQCPNQTRIKGIARDGNQGSGVGKVIQPA